MIRTREIKSWTKNRVLLATSWRIISSDMVMEKMGKKVEMKKRSKRRKKIRSVVEGKTDGCK